MAILETDYMGLRLKNPLLVSSSGLTASVGKVKQCADAGAGGVVLKSIFEEAIAKSDWGLDNNLDIHPEAYEYFQAHLELQYGAKDYCDFIKEVKQSVDIPIIASVNCLTDKLWPSYAAQLEVAGADALELNVFLPAVSPAVGSQELENIYLSIVSQVKERVSIPVSIKIAPYFTSLPNMAARLADKGCDGLVLFNRFVEPDIDLDTLEPVASFAYSTAHDSLSVLRWISLLSDQFPGAISATTGVHSEKEMIKYLLAGASTVQAASLFYNEGLSKIESLLVGLEKWMEQHSFDSIEQFCGKASLGTTDKPDQLLRAQFVEKISQMGSK